MERRILGGEKVERIALQSLERHLRIRLGILGVVVTI